MYAVLPSLSRLDQNRSPAVHPQPILKSLAPRSMVFPLLGVKSVAMRFKELQTQVDWMDKIYRTVKQRRASFLVWYHQPYQVLSKHIFD